MTSDEQIKAALDRVDNYVDTYQQVTNIFVTDIKLSVTETCLRLKEETSVRIAYSEAVLLNFSAVTELDTEFHLLRAYFHASPSLWAIILAIYGFIQLVVEIVSVINSILTIITGETLAYWLNQIFPGFEDAWNGMMNKISEFSAALGWGVDGVLHLMNVAGAGAYTVGAITGKDPAWTKSKAYTRVNNLMFSCKNQLSQWQENPGQMIARWAEFNAENDHIEGAGFINDIVLKLSGAGDKIETVAKGLGDMTSEFLSLRENMPQFVAKNIPQVIWDAIGYADTMINDRLLPRLDQLTGRLDELDNLLDKYSSDTRALAGRIARPGDLLAEIAALPDYVRADQESKIDSAVSGKLGRDTALTRESALEDLREFELERQARIPPQPPPSFMTIDAPGRILPPGITAEPRETWLVGDF